MILAKRVSHTKATIKEWKALIELMNDVYDNILVKKNAALKIDYRVWWLKLGLKNIDGYLTGMNSHQV